MCQMQPSLVGLDGVRPLTVLHFGNGMIFALVDNLLVLHLCVSNIITQSPADTTTAARIDKTILRTGVEGILTINEFRM